MNRPLLTLLLVLACGAPITAKAAPSRLVVWAWERPEDLNFLPADVEIAVQTGFVELSADRVFARRRRLPLRARPNQAVTAVVHVQIDNRQPLVWSAQQRTEALHAVMRLSRLPNLRRLQIDFEVRASQVQTLGDLLQDVRAAAPPGVLLSMTALASWCGSKSAIAALPVDEIVPMLFRMGRDGGAYRNRLAHGGDFDEPRCRTAIAISTDTPIPRAPPGRRVYLFNPRSWTAEDFALARRRVSAWDAP
jgi:hypothetical protein